MLLARDTFGEGVETVLEPSPETFGAADLGVLIEPDPWTGFAAVDNRGSRLYGPLTLGAGASVYNMLGFNERIDALIAFAPENNSLAFGQLRLDAPIAALSGTALDGSRFSVEADRSRADPDLARSGSPQDLDVIQNETNVGVAMFTPFVRTRAENLFGRVALVWRESESLTGFAGSDDTDQDRLLVVQARVTWDVADSFGGVTLVDGWLHQGVSIDGVTETSGSGPAAGDDTFTLGALNLSRLQRLGATDWSLYGLFIGQYAADNLPNSERFTLGDATIGRGFAPGNTSGDSGYGARLELRRLVAGPENGELLRRSRGLRVCRLRPGLRPGAGPRRRRLGDAVLGGDRRADRCARLADDHARDRAPDPRDRHRHHRHRPRDPVLPRRHRPVLNRGGERLRTGSRLRRSRRGRRPRGSPGRRRRRSGADPPRPDSASGP